MQSERFDSAAHSQEKLNNNQIMNNDIIKIGKDM